MMYIILGVIMIFFAWMQAAYAKLKLYKNEAREAWVRIDALLKTRSAYILRLLELAAEHGFNDRELLSEMFDLDGGYAHSDDREEVSARAEAITPLLDQLFDGARDWQALAENVEFQERKTDLLELEEDIAGQSMKYNNSVNLYNNHREKPSLKLQMAILGAIPLKGFYIRNYSLSEDMSCQKSGGNFYED